MRSFIKRFGRLAVTTSLCAITAAAALAPSDAHAFWARRGYGWVWVGPRVAYAPPPVYVGPRPLHWVHGHRDWRGYWIPAHWG